MSTAHLDILNHQLPELFQTRDLAPDWHEEWLVVPINDPESFITAGSDPRAESSTIADEADWSALENFDSVLGNPDARMPEISTLIVDILGGAHSGAPLPYTNRDRMPPPDCLAFYLPFHYYYPTYWGIYLLYEGVEWLAGEIVRRSGGQVPRHTAMQSARLFLYYHEAFHHKTECFATRLELTHRKPFYKTGFERLYQKTFLTDACLEEGLANASALKDSDSKLKDSAVNKALEAYVLANPPGYDQGVRIRGQFQPVRCEFAEENQRICLPHLPGKDPSVWRTAPHMFNGITNIKSRVNYLVPRSSSLSGRLPFRPVLPPGKLIKKLKELAGLEFVRNGANHDVYRARNGKKIQIPRHPRDLGRGLVRNILQQAGLNIGIEEFLQH